MVGTYIYECIVVMGTYVYIHVRMYSGSKYLYIVVVDNKGWIAQEGREGERGREERGSASVES